PALLRGTHPPHRRRRRGRARSDRRQAVARCGAQPGGDPAGCGTAARGSRRAGRPARIARPRTAFAPAGSLPQPVISAFFDRSMAINVRSMVLTMRAFLPPMLERGDGSIINIASVVSTVMAAPDRFAYATSKAAVIGLTMAVARDYIARG